MHGRTVSLGTFAQALWPWLKRANVFWSMLTVLLAAFAVAFWPETTEPRIRVTGWVLELFGLGTVAWGLEKTRREFGRPHFFENTRTWWAQRPRLRTRVGSLAGHASLGTLSTSGHLQTKFNGPSNLTLEQRIGELEAKVQAMNGRIEQAQIDLLQEISARKQALTLERDAREKQGTEIRHKLETVETGGLHISMVGVIWLAVGLTLSTIPNELLCLWK